MKAGKVEWPGKRALKEEAESGGGLPASGGPALYLGVMGEAPRGAEVSLGGKS